MPRFRIHTFLLLAVDLAQHYEKVVTLLALDETSRTDERFDMGAGVAAFWTRERVLALAAASITRGCAAGGFGGRWRGAARIRWWFRRSRRFRQSHRGGQTFVMRRLVVVMRDIQGREHT